MLSCSNGRLEPLQQRQHGPQSLKYCPSGPLPKIFAASWIVQGSDVLTCKQGFLSKGLQWNSSRISVPRSSNSCSRQFMLHSRSFKYISARYNNHENWPVSTWLHAGENPAKFESTKWAQRKWNKLEICCFLFVRFKWELCFLANSQCGQVTIFADIIFSSL